MESKYHIITDLQCRVFHYGKEICIAAPGEDVCIELLKGRHLLSFVSVKNPAVSYKMTFEVPESGIEDFIEVRLIPVPEAVDLGLPSGLKWSSFNLGASSPGEYGDYYAWGETEPKDDYSWSTLKYFYSEAQPVDFSKYNTLTAFGRVRDNKTQLDLDDDVAHIKLGGKWRMPTREEFKELIDYCVAEMTTMNGVRGRKFTSKKNGRSIFFPAAGLKSDTFPIYGDGSYGHYWSSSLYTGFPTRAWHLEFYSDDVRVTDDKRNFGRSVRPVYDE